MKKQNTMVVSVGIVALNEEEFLPRVLDDLKAQTYPHNKIEILLIDSGSTDKTREIMQEFKKTAKNDFPQVQVLDNPGKRQACGWNIAIDNFKGDALGRIDAHSKIPDTFIEKNVNLLCQGEKITGGPRPNVVKNENKWQQALSLAENSLFGSSINSCRRVNTTKQYVKTMFHAFYKREVFDAVGGLNENLGRTEDNELHYRMRKAGFKLCFDSAIVSYQYSRNSLKKMIKQKFQNGYWIGRTVYICPGCLSIFYFAPIAFVIALITAICLAIFHIYWPIITIGGAYLGLVLIITIITQVKNSANPYVVFFPIMLFLLHTSYGIGTMAGLCKGAWIAIRKKDKLKLD